MNLQQIKENADLLIKLLESIKSQTEYLEGREKALIALDYKVQEKHKQNEKNEAETSKQNEILKEQNEYLDRKKSEQNKREEYINGETKKLSEKEIEVKNKIDELNIKEGEIKNLLEREEKLKLLESELKNQQLMIAKEKVIDNERKQILDLREKHIKQEEQRLSTLASRLS